MKNLGSVLALYPTPLVVVGTFSDGKPTWTLVGHLGIMDHIMVSLAKPHYINAGIIENKVLSVNIVDEALLERADYVGCVSGRQTDKSEVFPYVVGEKGAPVITDAPLSMECVVEDNYETKGFDNFILTIANTYADQKVLNENGKIDYGKLKPVLFEMPTYQYLKTGEFLGACKSLGKK
ncbi:MAG: flavin reductase family protein [Clostridiales bacterium]|nr:flavin reductase family protein [Clostridiales bacterium]